jgi:hypothetical protein
MKGVTPMEPTVSREVAPVFGFCFIAAFAVFGLAIFVLTLMIYCKIFSKAGYHWAMGLLLLIPFGNLILLLVLAFGQWPILRELETLKQSSMAPPPEGQPHESFRNI